MKYIHRIPRLARITSGTVISFALTAEYFRHRFKCEEIPSLQNRGLYISDLVLDKPPSREQFKTQAQETSDYDLIIIGGGATGVGILYDAKLRGLKAILIERDDFASGTSSKSTKLVHGGVRYLEKAILGLDYNQYALVREALKERKVFLHVAPYLSRELPTMLPIYQWWKVPYFYLGSKMYDLLAGKESLNSCYFMGKARTIEMYPLIRSDGLKGSMVYYDGQHNDARMNVIIALSAAKQGAAVLNHTEVIELLKEDNITKGVKVRDNITGEEYSIKAKGVINATGPFTDDIRLLDNPSSSKIVSPSSGVHIVLPNYFSPTNMGLIDPSTSDGRVIFLLPWEGSVLAGTTDNPCKITSNPIPSEEEIEFILGEIRNYLDPRVLIDRSDVLAAWAGIRPLVCDPNAKNSQAVVRSHMINISESKLITIAGGKWTTYRAMAEETLDMAIKTFDLEPKNGCTSKYFPLIGSYGYFDSLFIDLIKRYGIETDIAKYLASNYGDRAYVICELALPTDFYWSKRGHRLINTYPYLEEEILYSIRYEYAQTLSDVLARRMRLAFINVKATDLVSNRVADIMTKELGWSDERKEKELQNFKIFLKSMGLK